MLTELCKTATEAGSLRDLQTHLDRKKFALARNKGTNTNILHKAVAMGHKAIAM